MKIIKLKSPIKYLIYLLGLLRGGYFHKRLKELKAITTG